MVLIAGDTFAGYGIVRRLGAGGMGEVYLARHPRLQRCDAIKILPASMNDPEYRQRFDREAELQAALQHPNIVRVYDRGVYGGQLWISMEYVDGTDASKLLRKRYPAGMPIDEVIDIVTAIADALDHAHYCNLLHRDVKPANILLTKPAHGRRQILLADFGIARHADDKRGLTETNMTVGSVSYAPPEQLRGLALNGRVDQYALAATAFHLLTGSTLFPQSNPAVVISHHLETAPPRVATFRPDLAWVDEVLSTALAKDPKARFRRCKDFADTLARQAPAPAHQTRTATRRPARIKAKGQSSPPRVAKRTAPPQPKRRSALTPRRRSRRGPSVASAALMIALAATWVHSMKYDADPANLSVTAVETSEPTGTPLTSLTVPQTTPAPQPLPTITSTASSTSASRSTTHASPSPSPYPTPSGRGPRARITLQDYIRDKDITQIQVKQGDWKAPTINLPLPHGWSDAGSRTPVSAWAAIVPDQLSDPIDSPSVVASMSKLVGNVDIPMVLVYSSGELYDLPGYSPEIEPTLSILDGYRSADVAGTYYKHGMRHVVVQKAVAIPANSGVYVLQLTAEGPEADARSIANAMEEIDRLTTIIR